MSESNNNSQAFGIAGLVLGIVAVLSCGYYFIAPVLGIVFSAIGLSKAKKDGSPSGLAVAGLVLSIIAAGIFILAISFLFAAIGFAGY